MNQIVKLICRNLFRLVPVAAVLLYASGCAGVSAEKNAENEEKKGNFPAERAFDAKRIAAGRILAGRYIAALNKALETGKIDPLQPMLPRKGGQERAKKVFESLRKALESCGKMENCRYAGRLDCTFYADYFWKYRFVKPTGDPRYPEQCFEALYRVRVAYPGDDPVIVKADFIFR